MYCNKNNVFRINNKNKLISKTDVFASGSCRMLFLSKLSQTVMHLKEGKKRLPCCYTLHNDKILWTFDHDLSSAFITNKIRFIESRG